MGMAAQQPHEPDRPSGVLYRRFHALGVGWVAKTHSRNRAAGYAGAVRPQ